jgi:hypothetical protein
VLADWPAQDSISFMKDIKMHANNGVLVLGGVLRPSGGTMMSYAQTAAARCRECDGLWRERSDALEEYLRILAERDAARKRRDHELVEAFEAIENESMERCYKAQQAVFNHEITHLSHKVGEDCRANSAEEMEATEFLSYLGHA